MTGQRGNRRRTRGVAIAAAVATAGALVLSVAVWGGAGWSLSGGEKVAGPQAATDLRELAARVGKLPDDTGEGRYAHVRTERWYDDEAVSADGTPADGLVRYHERRDEWFADDHSGRTVTDRTPEGGATEHEEGNQPALEVVGGDGGPEDHRFRALPTGDAAFARAIEDQVDGVLPWFAAGDSATEEDVARYLATHEDPGPYLSVWMVTEHFVGDDDHQPRTPRERAAALRYLASVDGVTVTDGVTDTAGRRGVAISLKAPADLLDGEGPAGITVLVDPKSGNVLAVKQSFAGASTDVRYTKPGDHVTVVHIAEFTDRLG